MMRRFGVLLVVLAVGSSGCAITGNIPGDEVVAYFTDTGDLVVGANVQMLDVEIGLVKDIQYELKDGQMVARVTLVVKPDSDVPAEGLQALIRQTSLLGEQFVELAPTTTGAPFVGDTEVTIPLENTTRRVDIETFLSDLSAFIGSGSLEDLNRFTHAQALILEERGQRFGQTIEELERFTGVLANRKLDIASAIDSLASAGKTLADNTATLDSFLDSLEEANVLLADQGDELQTLLFSLRRFGTVSSRFLSQHENAIDRQFRALRPIFRALASSDDELRADIGQLATFLELFTKSLGGGPGGTGEGDYIQVEAVLCEVIANCHTNGEKGDVPGQGQ